MNSDNIISAARSLIGVKFLHQGRSKTRGLDCAGLIVQVVKEIGIEYIDVEGYSTRPSGGQLEDTLDSQPCLKRIGREEMAPGDILLIRFGKDPQHLAIYTGENIIHSYANVGKVCEHRLSDIWRTRVVRVYRIIGVEP